VSKNKAPQQQGHWMQLPAAASCRLLERHNRKSSKCWHAAVLQAAAATYSKSRPWKGGLVLNWGCPHPVQSCGVPQLPNTCTTPFPCSCMKPHTCKHRLQQGQGYTPTCALICPFTSAFEWSTVLHVLVSLCKTACLWIGRLTQLEDHISPQQCMPSCHHVQVNQAEQECSILRKCTHESECIPLLVKISVFWFTTVYDARLGAVIGTN